MHPRFSDAEFAELQHAATDCSMSVGGYVAEAALAAARSEDPEAAVADSRRTVRELMTSNRHLGALGSNLNQLTRDFHIDGTFPAHSAALRLLDRIHATMDHLDSAVDDIIRR